MGFWYHSSRDWSKFTRYPGWVMVILSQEKYSPFPFFAPKTLFASQKSYLPPLKWNFQNTWKLSKKNRNKNLKGHVRWKLSETVRENLTQSLGEKFHLDSDTFRDFTDFEFFLIEWLNDWLIDLINLLIDWLIWSIGWLVDWLGD